MKTTFYFVLLIGLSVLASSCQDDDETPAPSTNDISITFPATWEVINNESGVIRVIGRSPLDGNSDIFSENVVITEEPAAGTSLETYYEASLVGLRSFNGFEALEEEDVVIDGVNTKRITFLATFNNLDLKYLTYILVHKDIGYTITCTALEDDFDAFKSTFEGIANTFKVPE